MECGKFLHVCTNFTVEFPTILEPLVQIILSNHEGYIDYAKELMYTALLDNISDITIKSVIAHILGPISYVMLLLLTIVIVFACVPLSFLIEKISRGVNSMKMQLCFCLESTLLIICTICLLIASFTYLFIAQQVYSVILQMPIVLRHMITDVTNIIRYYRLEVQTFNNMVDKMGNETVDKILEIPEKLRNILDKTCETNMIFEALNSTISHFGPETKRFVQFTNFQQTLNLEDDLVKDNFMNFINYSCHNQGRISADANNTIDDYKLHVMHGLQIIGEELKFGEILAENFKKSVNSLLTNSSKGMTIQHDEICMAKNLSTSFTLLDKPIERVENFTFQIEDFVERNTLGFFSAQLNYLQLILLGPGICGMVFILFLLAGLFLGIKEFKKYSKTGKSLKISGPIILQTSIIIIIPFLGFILIYTELVYLFFWPTAALCKSISDRSIYTRYFDNASLWNNSTWLNNFVNDTLIMNKTKLTNLLDRCGENESLITILNLDKKELETFYKSKLDLTSTQLQAILVDVLKNLTHQSSVLALQEEIAALEDLPISNTTMARLNEICEVPKDLEKYKDLHEFLGDSVKVLEFKWALREVKKTLSLITNFNEYILRKFDQINESGEKTFFDKVIKDIQGHHQNYIHYIRENVEQKLGNCYVLPLTINKATWITCDYILYITVALFVLLSIISFSLIFTIILTIRICKYMRGTFDYMKSVDATGHRYSSDTSKLIALKRYTSSSDLE